MAQYKLVAVLVVEFHLFIWICRLAVTSNRVWKIVVRDSSGTVLICWTTYDGSMMCGTCVHCLLSENSSFVRHQAATLPVDAGWPRQLWPLLALTGDVCVASLGRMPTRACYDIHVAAPTEHLNSATCRRRSSPTPTKRWPVWLVLISAARRRFGRVTNDRQSRFPYLSYNHSLLFAVTASSSYPLAAPSCNSPIFFRRAAFGTRTW